MVICSRSSDIQAEFKTNIADTVGADYELVVIDNSSNRHSIFSAYNEGVRKATGDIICFMHEDIVLETPNWGQNVIRHFADAELGLIGVFGGHYMPDLACHIGDSDLLASHYNCRFADGHTESYYTPEQFDASGEVEVVAVDGLWFAIPATLFSKIRFDETFNGFHYYDMDICMQVWQAGFKCKVVDDVMMTHRSAGCINQDFVNNSYKFLEKWRASLPMIKSSETYSDKELALSTELCRYKKYARELELEKQKNSTSKHFVGKLWKQIAK